MPAQRGFLSAFVADFADGLRAADAKRPQAVNQRTEKIFQPGIGPHTETQTVRLVVDEMRTARPAKYSRVELAVPYPTERRQKCDLVIHTRGEHWFIEVKMWRRPGSRRYSVLKFNRDRDIPTIDGEGLADAAPANPFRLPRLHRLRLSLGGLEGERSLSRGKPLTADS